jgi:aryl-alcohol dehydrogenase-like predicted oxidoreductase
MLQLDQRQLGASGIIVPALGIGTWSWGDKNLWGYGKEYTQDDIMQVYQVCQDAGLNFFDTAEIYGNGESERLLGMCAHQDGRPLIIASKFAPIPTRLSARQLLDVLDASLARLGVKSIDIYQIHWPYTFLHVNDLMDAMAEAVVAGKIRAVGVSNYNADQLRKAHARLARHDIPLASNQVHYSLFYRRPEVNGVLDVCRELNVALIAYSPLEQGLLTGKFRHGQTELPSFRRRIQGSFRPAQLERMEPLFQVMDEVAKAHDKSIGQVALNWLLAKDELIIPIPGAKTGHQARENAGAIGWRMSKDEMERIGDAAEPWLK